MKNYMYLPKLMTGSSSLASADLSTLITASVMAAATRLSGVPRVATSAPCKMKVVSSTGKPRIGPLHKALAKPR